MIRLTWLEAIPINARIDSYDVYRSLDGVDFTLIVSLPITYDIFMAITHQTLTYDDTDVTPYVEYTYFVVAKTDPPGPDTLTSNRIVLQDLPLSPPDNTTIEASSGALALAGVAPTVQVPAVDTGKLVFGFSLDQALQLFMAPLSDLTDITTYTFNGSLVQAIDGVRDFSVNGQTIVLTYSKDGSTAHTLKSADEFQSDVVSVSSPYTGGGAPIAIAYGAGVYLVGGGNSTVRNAYSSDGVTWTQNTNTMQSVMGTGSSINGIEFTDGIFLVSTRAGKIGTSTDGINWTLRNSSTPTNQNLAKFASDGAGKIIGLIGGRLVFSLDAGVNWDTASYLSAITSTSLNNSFTRFGFAYGNGVWVAGGRDSSSTAPFLFSSAVGNEASWTSRSVPAASPAIYSINDIVFDSANSRFIATATTSGDTGYLLTSPDGVTWSIAATVTGLPQNPENSSLAIYSGS